MMKKVIVFTLALVAVADSVMGQTYVTGYVKEAETGLGIQGVRVTVWGPLPSHVDVAEGSTDETGLYLLQIDEQGFQAGTYTLRVLTIGYYDLSASTRGYRQPRPGGARYCAHPC